MMPHVTQKSQHEVSACVSTISPCRRYESRLSNTCWCSYSMFKAVEGEPAVVLNQSAEGMLFFMGHAPHLSRLN